MPQIRSFLAVLFLHVQVGSTLLADNSGELKAGEGTFFEQVEALYYSKDATKPTSDDVGITVGRCFKRDEGLKPYPSFIMVRPNTTAGPIGSDALEFAGKSEEDKSPSYYDHLSYRELEALVESGPWVPTFEREGGLITGIVGIKKVGAYIVMLYFYDKNQNPTELYWACYYYAKKTPSKFN